MMTDPSLNEGGGEAKQTDFLASLRSSGDTATAPIDSSTRSRNMNIVIIAGGLVVAAGALFVMRQLGLGAGTTFAEVTIDYQFDQKETAVTDHERILTDLQTSREIVQVPLDEIQMNPFAWNMRRDTEFVSESVSAEALQAEREKEAAEARRREIQMKFERLVLHSVIGGRVPVAQISGKVVKVGDLVNDTFTVEVIDGRSRSVDLSAGEDTFTLSIKNEG